MIGEENEKNLQLIKTIACGVIYFIIGIVIIFTFCLSKVDAASQYHYRNSSNALTSWANTTQDTTYNFGTQNVPTSYVVAMQFRDSTTFTGNNKYDYFVSGKYWIVVNDDRTINFNIQTAIYNGTNVASTGNACIVNATQSTKKTQNILTGYQTRKDISFSVSCSGLFSSGYYPLITIQFKSDVATSGIGQLTFNNSNMVQTTSSIDSSSIINNQNNNTNTIVNNNNQNTQTIVNGQQETTDAVNDLNDTIKDDSVDNPSNSLNNMENYFGTNGVISDLLLLPVRMFQNIVNTIDGTCSSFNLGSLFGHNLTMPCINLSNRLGSALYGVIDVLISGFFILAIRKKFVDIFEHFTSLKTGGNELE